MKLSCKGSRESALLRYPHYKIHSSNLFLSSVSTKLPAGQFWLAADFNEILFLKNLFQEHSSQANEVIFHCTPEFDSEILDPNNNFNEILE